MLMSFVILPESFSKEHFTDKVYSLQMLELLKRIQINGLILIDEDERLLKNITEKVKNLPDSASSIKIFWTDFLKIKKSIFIKIRCDIPETQSSICITSIVADACKPDVLLTDDNHHGEIEKNNPAIKVVSVSNYLNSTVEVERNKRVHSLPPLNEMGDTEFDKLLIAAIRFSRKLLLYDPYIGAKKNAYGFQRGIGRILRLWKENAYFATKPHETKLSMILYTIPDPKECQLASTKKWVESLSKKYDISIELIVKKKSKLNHDRYLQTEFTAISFLGGFDFLDWDNQLRACLITMASGVGSHLKRYRESPNASSCSQ